MNELYSITDLLTRDLGPRQHELTNPATGKIERFKFAEGEATRCPRWAALALAALPGFEVADPRGKRLRIAAARRAAPARDLAPDEVVARLEELTQDALLARCQARDSGCGFGKSTRKTELVDWLLAREDGMAVGGTDEEDALGEIVLDEEAA